MAKWCFNYESGEYEYIEKDGFSIDRGEYVYNWDDSDYRHDEEEHHNSLFNDEDDDWPQLLKKYQCAIWKFAYSHLFFDFTKL